MVWVRTWLTERFGLDVPVVAAPMASVGGGELTAAGVWAGTAFLTCTEAMTAPPARQRLLGADETSTVYGIVFDRASRAGWPDELGGRALRNSFFDGWYGREDELRADDAAHQEYVPGVRATDAHTLSMYAGQGVGALAAERSAADVVADFAPASDLLRKAAR